MAAVTSPCEADGWLRRTAAAKSNQHAPLVLHGQPPARQAHKRGVVKFRPQNMLAWAWQLARRPPKLNHAGAESAKRQPMLCTQQDHMQLKARSTSCTSTAAEPLAQICLPLEGARGGDTTLPKAVSEQFPGLFRP